MKYLKQLGIILVISFAGEGLHALLPLPVPASIYGIVLMLIALCTKIVKVEQVKETGAYLVEILPILFIPPVVGFIGMWDMLSKNILQYLAISIISMAVVMVTAGRVTQAVIRHQKKKEAEA